MAKWYEKSYSDFSRMSEKELLKTYKSAYGSVSRQGRKLRSAGLQEYSMGYQAIQQAKQTGEVVLPGMAKGLTAEELAKSIVTLGQFFRVSHSVGEAKKAKKAEEEFGKELERDSGGTFRYEVGKSRQSDAMRQFFEMVNKTATDKRYGSDSIVALYEYVQNTPGITTAEVIAHIDFYLEMASRGELIEGILPDLTERENLDLYKMREISERRMGK